jgi:two-component sensor histidine kinase
MLQETSDRSRMIVNSISAALVMILAELFRRAVVHATQDRDLELAKRMLIHEEFEHRTKNNFSLVISLLRLQRSKANDELSRLLDQTITRIMCISEVYASISLEDQLGSNISIQPYLTKLVERITSAAFGPDVEVTIIVADASFSREIAGAIGLFANEALTNCAKYAFPNGRAGNVRVDLKVDGLIWTLIVQDDGMGRNTPAVQSIPGGGSGSRIMKAFAQQAGASHSLRITDKGCVAQLTGKLA